MTVVNLFVMDKRLVKIDIIACGSRQNLQKRFINRFNTANILLRNPFLRYNKAFAKYVQVKFTNCV